MGAREITIEEIRALFRREGLQEEFHEQEPLFLWPQIAGEQMSKLTRPLRIRDEVFYVETANHIVAQQLSLLKDAYLEKLNRCLGEERLRDIRFRVGRFPGSPPHEPSEGEQLDLLERGELAELLDHVDDPRMMETFKHWMLAQAEQDRRRKAQGGRRCVTCGVYHGERDEICYYCRLEGRHP